MGSDKGIDGVNSDLGIYPRGKEPFNIFQFFRGRCYTRLVGLPIVLGKRGQADLSFNILPISLEKLDKTLGDKTLGQKGDINSLFQEDGHSLVCHLKDVWVRLKTVGGSIKDHHARKPSASVAIQFPAN